MHSADLYAWLIEATLATSAATLAVLAMRKPLRETFGAARYKKANSPWQERFMPPIVTSHNEHHIVMGQRKWKVQGGFPHVCHGGLSLLEVAVPFIELPALCSRRA